MHETETLILFFRSMLDSYDRMLIKQGRLELNQVYQANVVGFHKNSKNIYNTKGNKGQ